METGGAGGRLGWVEWGLNGLDWVGFGFRLVWVGFGFRLVWVGLGFKLGLV